MDFKNIPKRDISIVIDNSLIQIKEKILKNQPKHEQVFELECLKCGILYYGNKKFGKCQYCFDEMKPYKFEDWQREIINKFLERYKGNYIWLRR